MPQRHTRRRLLQGLATLSLPLAGCVSAPEGTQTDSTDRPTATPGDSGLAGRTLGAELVANGFTSPVGVEIPEPGRYFIVDQRGIVYLHRDGETWPYLDIRDRIVELSGYEERGLLGLAFHPEFSDNGQLYVRYSAPPRSGTPDSYDHTFVLSEFRADPTADTVESESERTVLEIPEPQSNHNGGAICFGPDGYLYVSVGDGGAANDRGPGHASDWYALAGGNGQDITENLLGSILRIDVDTVDEDRPYGIPPENPLVDRAGRPEHFAWGLRNPWRMSFTPDGRLLAADVGQNRWEELNVVQRGGNYGWNVYEGTHCFRRQECPTVTPDGERLRPPVVEYSHTGGTLSGLAIVGGYLYHGTSLPAFDGAYLFADWQAKGRLFAARPRETGLWPTNVIPVTNDAMGTNVLGFGQQPDGEILVCTTERADVGGSTGAVFRLTPP